MLEDMGHQVTQAANGKKALESLRTGPCDFDLMISDYAMPHVSGTDFLREARELCPDVPALIITGYAEIDAIGDRPEGVDVLLKPFTAKALAAAVSRICAPAAMAS
jgi:CheY-like chemotaxis protein